MMGVAKALSNLVNTVDTYHMNVALADREHTEMREDTAYQRAVADMRKAGLNPYTVGANPAPSSASNAGQQTISNNLALLGSLLDIGNLNVKNKMVVNNMISSILGFAGKALAYM